MDTSLKLINVHYQTTCNRRIDLVRLNEIVGCNGKFHRGRPYMIACQIMKKRVLFFPNGTIQLLGGNINPPLLHQISSRVLCLLRQYNSAMPPRPLQWKVNNMVFQFDLRSLMNFSNSVCNKYFSYNHYTLSCVKRTLTR